MANFSPTFLVSAHYSSPFKCDYDSQIFFVSDLHDSKGYTVTNSWFVPLFPPFCKNSTWLMSHIISNHTPARQ